MRISEAYHDKHLLPRNQILKLTPSFLTYPVAVQVCAATILRTSHAKAQRTSSLKDREFLARGTKTICW